MTDNSNHRQIRLGDGRLLGYTEYGVLDGKPVFYFHGFPGSRFECPIFDPHNTAAGLNVRIIAVDRPGMGLSDFKQNRKLLDWPDDVSELADSLGMDRFAVVGVSGGGPYVLACAFKIPDRLTVVGVVSGMGPSDAPGMREGESWTLPGKFPLLRRLMIYLFSLGLEKQPERIIEQTIKVVSEPDQKMLEDPDVSATFIAGLREAFRQGSGGVNLDAVIYSRPWGFSLQDITADVQLWQGELDNNVPVSVGRFMADTIPGCRAEFFENEGHFTLFRNRFPDILNQIMAR